MNFLQRTPFFRLLLSFIIGIILFQYLLFPKNILLISTTCFIVFLFALYSFVTSKKKTIFRYRWVFGLIVMLIFISFGYLISSIFEEKHYFSELNCEGIYLVELKSPLLEKENTYKCTIELIQRIDSSEIKKAKGNAILYLEKDSIVSPLLMGDRLLIQTTFIRPSGVQNPQGFDYAGYLKRQGVNASAYVSSQKWTKVGKNESFSIFRFSERIRNHFLKIYKEFNITGDEFGVLAALTLGYKETLETSVREHYSATGATHILSVSGLHVGIVYGVIYFLLSFLNKSPRQKKVRILISTIFIWFYAFITGLSPAVFRAALMFTFVAVAAILNRKSIIYNTIFLSAFVMLLFNPNLLFNIGFQLSYAAVLSIVFFEPKINKLITVKSKPVKWLWELTAVSVAAQIGTAPFAIYYFQQFPNYFLLTNYVAIPLATIIISLAILLFVTSFIPHLSTIIAFFLQKSVWLMNFLINKIVELPHSTSTISMNVVQLILAFIALFLITAFFFNKKFNHLISGLICTLALVFIFAYQHYCGLKNTKMIVFSSYSAPIVNFIDHSRNYVFTTDSVVADRTASAYWNMAKLQAPEYIHQSDWQDESFVFFKGKRIFILYNDLLKNKCSNEPLEVDFLIITNRIKPKMDQILMCIHPKTVIIDNSISPWYTNHIISICKEHEIPFYSIAAEGAFIFSFDN